MQRKTNRLQQHGVMANIKNTLSRENRKDFWKKTGHQKNINVDFIGSICKQMITYAKHMITQTRVGIGLIVKQICLSDGLIFAMICSCL